MKMNKIIFSILTLFTATQVIVSMVDFGGFGNLNIKTGNITFGDISAFTTEINSCQNNVSSSCESGSVCNVTVGPCVVKTGQKLNAAPTEIDFSRFFVTTDPLVITVNKPATIPLFNLDQTNNYTVIIQCPFSSVAYMFIGLPTEKWKVDAIKNLPLGLAHYLKQKTGSFIKVYRAKGESAGWSEISEMRIGTSLDDDIIKRSNIINIEIIDSGDLVLTYRNLKRQDDSVIPTTRVIYATQ